MAQDPFSPDAWTRARNRFVEDLTDEEQRLFSRASPETILDDASATEKTHRATSTTRGVVTKLQPFVEAVQQYGNALDVYSNIYPLVMGPLWGSVRVVLHLAWEAGKYFEKIADMFNQISHLLPRVRIFEQLFPTHERLVQSLSVVYFDVLNFCSDSKVMFRKTKYTLLTLAWKPFARQFGSQMEAFQRHQKEIEDEVSLSHMIEAKDSRALIRSSHLQLAGERYDEDRLRVFATLSSAVDYEAKHRKLRGLRYEGTGTWIYQHPAYVAWKEATTSKGLFCHGIPGSGKSVLTSLIVDDHLEGPRPLDKNIIYFYCDYADLPTLQPQHIYRALLQQLFFKGLMNEAIEKSIVEALRSNIHSLSEQKLADFLRSTIESCPSLHIIIDGLDECDRDIQQDVTNTLYRLMSCGHFVLKILVTCRDEGHLLAGISIFSRLHVSRRASAADMQAYISHAISSSISSGQLTLRNMALKDEIISRLVAKAQGMFLWVHFQITDLCDAASDEVIRQVLDHLPEGLYDTYTRIIMKIAKTGSNFLVLKTMMWILCARRPLRIDELQEAVAFDSHDKSWDIDKIPDGDKLIRSCHGLVVRDVESGRVHLAHHTVQQYLISPQESALAASFADSMPRAPFFAELSRFSHDPHDAERMAASLCVTYLCFSDFERAVSRKVDEKQFNVAAAFKDRGPVSIPAALGLGKYLGRLPYTFFGSRNNIKMPDIDYSKYLKVRPKDRGPSPHFKGKYALLEYVIEYWPWHTHSVQWPKKSRSFQQCSNLVLHKSLPFEFRPWGPTQHFGPFGCKGCPVPRADDVEPKDLPSMALVHWAAETGHLNILGIVEPQLQDYLEHERHHDETLLIACRHGQDAVVELLLKHRVFDLSDDRAIVATGVSGNESTLELLLRAQDEVSLKLHPYAFKDENGHPISLYQAASNGHTNIVKVLLARKVDTDVKDTATGLMSLQIAAKNGHLQVVRALCGGSKQKKPLSPELDSPHQETGMTALHYAAENGHVEIVASLIQRGSRCDSQDSSDETALIKASRNGHAMVAKIMLDRGANPIIRGGAIHGGHGGQRPMAVHHAASNGHDLVLDILQHWPCLNYRCGADRTNTLHLGAAYGHPKVVHALLSKGVEIESIDSDGMTALHYASRHGQDLVIDMLLDRGSKVNGITKGGYTALHFAAEAAHVESVKLLMARGAAISVKTKQEGDTALHLAAHNPNADTVKALVECGAPLEDQNKYSQTPLHIAILWSLEKNVSKLIELGAHWIRDEFFWDAASINDWKVLDLFMTKLSTATTAEQEDAAAVIKNILEVDHIRQGARRILLTWLWTRETQVRT